MAESSRSRSKVGGALPMVETRSKYAQLMRQGISNAEACRILTIHVVAHHAKAGVIELLRDDTLFHKSGRKVNGVGIFRDAVRPTIARVVYALGLNLVVITIRIQPSFPHTYPPNLLACFEISTNL